VDEKTKSNCGVPRFSASDVSSTRQRLRATTGSDARLTVSRELFSETMGTLRERGAGWRESAAVWGGVIAGDLWQAQIVYFHHELGDDRGGPLSLELSESAKFRLYDTLKQKHLRLVALIHTHPCDWVDLSDVDRENQLSSRLGFWSIVVPWYAQRSWNSQEMGIHERTEEGWHRLSTGEVERRFKVER